MPYALDRRPGLPATDLHERIREAAFALLMTERRPIAPDEIATATGARIASLSMMLDQLVGAGWTDRDEQGGSPAPPG
jgi:DNA-binding IclR family transcriptional regulator